jgi:hypothetical protein
VRFWRICRAGLKRMSGIKEVIEISLITKVTCYVRPYLGRGVSPSV